MELYDVMVKAMNESCKKTRERHLVELLEKELDENRQHTKKESNNIIIEVTNYLKQNYDGKTRVNKVKALLFIILSLCLGFLSSYTEKGCDKK